MAPSQIRRPRTGLAVASLLAWLSCPGCVAPKIPNEYALQAVAADAVVDGLPRVLGLRSHPVIVLDESRLGDLPPVLVELVKQRLSVRRIGWEQVRYHPDPAAPPGGGPVPFVLEIELVGEGGERTLRWGARCGATCGGGEELRLRYEDGRWTSAPAGRFRYGPPNGS